MRLLITGAAGFIGASLTNKLIKSGCEVLGIDNLNSYYQKQLKYDRLDDIIEKSKRYQGKWIFEQCDLKDRNNILKIVKKFSPDTIVNLAAQAGVRYSIENPYVYIETNLLGFCNILDACKESNVKNLVYASSSSVYGSNLTFPYHEDQKVNHPLSLYAATKKCNEILAHSYSSLYNIPATGLRFFTVYGPWGRPDMAPMIFAKNIFEKKPINIFNYGNMQRDFTYIDDIVNGVFKCCFKAATPNQEFNYLDPEPSTSFAPHRIFNIGNSRPVSLEKFIELLEKEIGIKAIKNYKEIQMGEVVKTASDYSKLNEWVGFEPKRNLEEGIPLFIKWYKNYYKI